MAMCLSWVLGFSDSLPFISHTNILPANQELHCSHTGLFMFKNLCLFLSQGFCSFHAFHLEYLSPFKLQFLEPKICTCARIPWYGLKWNRKWCFLGNKRFMFTKFSTVNFLFQFCESDMTCLYQESKSYISLFSLWHSDDHTIKNSIYILVRWFMIHLLFVILCHTMP